MSEVPEVAGAEIVEQEVVVAPSEPIEEDNTEEEQPTEEEKDEFNAQIESEVEALSITENTDPTKTILPVKQYLETTVVPLVMSAMQSLANERPSDPIAYLATYLLKHNPKNAE